MGQILWRGAVAAAARCDAEMGGWPLPVQYSHGLISGGTECGQLFARGTETQVQAPVCQQTNETQAHRLPERKEIKAC